MGEAFLGVARSLTAKHWVAAGAGGPGAERVALALAQRNGLPEVVARVMAARGIGLDEADAFLAPSLRGQMPDPYRIKDMRLAAERIAAAIRGREPMAIFADYDVDGATSAALLQRFLAAAGAMATVYVPDRMTEGYGPTAEALLALKADGARLVVTVDCGITGFAALAAAADAGLEVIVVDHHVAEPQLPRAVAVVNPNRLDEETTAELGRLAAVGVTFLLVVAVNRVLREAGHWPAGGEPDLMGWLDLVALGTVCDVVPLTGLNRAYVAQGLKVLGRRGNPGLAALSDVARIDSRPDPYHLGFVLGPRVNAGGRVGDSGLGARLLATEDAAEAGRIAARLDQLNEERREIEAKVLDEAMSAAESGLGSPVLVVAGDGWHPGVIGIVAGRLKERYDRPACVIAWEADGTGRGSGRSVPGVALGSAVIAAHQDGILLAGGGHAMAAGFTIERGRLDDFRAYLAGRVTADIGTEPAMPRLALDGLLAASGAARALVDQLARVGPFGAGNREPRFALPAVRIVKADTVGQNHVRCILTDAGGGRLKAMAFRALDGPLGPALLSRGGRAVLRPGPLRPAQDGAAGRRRWRPGIPRGKARSTSGSPATAAGPISARRSAAPAWCDCSRPSCGATKTMPSTW